jgi:subfamily B ATP-binding cassette protein MsbA
MKKTAFESVNIYKRLLKYAMPSWPKLTGAVLCMVGYAIFNGFVSAAIYVVFNGFTNHGKVVIEKIPQFHLQHPIEIPLFAIPIVLVTVFILRGLFEFGSNYLMGSVGLKAIMQIRNELQAHIVRLSMDFFSRRRTGELMSRVLNDVGTIQNAISSVLVDLTREPLVILFNIPWILLPLTSPFFSALA